MSLGVLTNFKVKHQESKLNNVISFSGNYANEEEGKQLPRIKFSTPKELDPVRLPGVPREFAAKIIEAANESGKSVGEYLAPYLKHLLSQFKGVIPEPSVTDKVGDCKVTSLIDAKQIFNKIIDTIKSAEKSIQVEMFEMQNLKVDGDIWPSSGAENVPGWNKQQEIVDLLINKKKANPELKIQVILDVHKWYQDGFGEYKRHFSNMKMVKYLKENGIDVVPYPRTKQGGTVLQHVKFLAVDSKKVVLGGMNWGNHSSANHDACVYIESNAKANAQNKGTEVDNIIDKIFNDDWKFAWQRLGKTKMVSGPTCPEEQDEYKGKAKEILQENIDYMKIVGTLYNNPADKNRYAENRLDLPEVKPIDKPAIKTLINRPKEYNLIGKAGEESIGQYIKDQLETATSLKAELFVLSHKEIVNKIVERYKEAQNGGRPFDCQILISPGILDDFPYCRNAYKQLEEAGVPIRMFNGNKDISQRLHTKWAVFNENELLIGSANWSGVGLENNIETGLRNDYPLTNKVLNERVAEYKERVDELEKELGLTSLYNEDKTIDFAALKDRRNAIKKDFASIESANAQKIEDLETVQLPKIDQFKKLLGYYNLIKVQEEKKATYKRGNHECATAIPSKAIAQTFLKQFSKDWEFSVPVVSDGYGESFDIANDTKVNPDMEAYREAFAEISFSGNKINKVV